MLAWLDDQAPEMSSRGRLPPRRAFRWAALRAGALTVTIALGACSLFAPAYQRPEVAVIGVRLAGGTLLRQNFLVSLQVHNPNHRALPVREVHAELRVAGESVATALTRQSFVVPAEGSADVDMDLSVNMAGVLLNLATRRDHPDAIDYEVTGAADVDLPFVHTLPFRQGGSYSLKGLQ